jgi:hypothetical protein
MQVGPNAICYLGWVAAVGMLMSVGCQPTRKPVISTETPRVTVPALPSASASPTDDQPAPTAILLPPPTYVVRYQPIGAASALPPDLDLPAQLVVANVGVIQILGFRGQEPREIPDYQGCLATSPNGLWLEVISQMVNSRDGNQIPR